MYNNFHFSFSGLLCTLLCLILVLILTVLEIRLTKYWNKMVSVLQNVKATMAWRKHQLLADLDENESPVPNEFKRRASPSSLSTIRMSLRKRVPLKQVELNFHKTPTWESLEARQKCQTLQSIKRTARNAFGTVSQVLCLCSGVWMEFSFCFNFSTKISGVCTECCIPEGLSCTLAHHNGCLIATN